MVVCVYVYVCIDIYLWNLEIFRDTGIMWYMWEIFPYLLAKMRKGKTDIELEEDNYLSEFLFQNP